MALKVIQLRQFEPYRWRPCGVTWTLFPNSRDNKAAANLRLFYTQIMTVSLARSRAASEPGQVRVILFRTLVKRNYVQFVHKCETPKGASSSTLVLIFLK